MTGKLKRLAAANQLLLTIATCGRRFFWSPGRIARFDLAENGRVWFVDDYTGKRIYTHRAGRWRHFSHGGTMQDLVIYLRDFISKGTPVRPGFFGPWPKHYCDGDLWGYGDDMRRVRARAEQLGIIPGNREAA